jgi:hypothetical protein
VNLQLSISIAAVFKSERLELMLARTKGHRRHLNRAAVCPVATLKLRTVHSDEGTVAIISVQTERVGALAVASTRACGVKLDTLSKGSRSICV